jgi:hypothetical protein
MEKQKVGRNDPCPCGSGKKYKKCCEEKVLKKKFKAEVIQPQASTLSSLFKKSVVPIKPPEVHHNPDALPPQ